MKWMILLFIFSCGGPKVDVEVQPKDPKAQPPQTPGLPPDTPPDLPDRLSWANVSNVLEQDCNQSGCHAGADFTSEEQAFLNSNSKARVANGSMPPKYSKDFNQWTDEKKNLILEFFERAGK